MNETPSTTLSILRDVANGKRRAFSPGQPVSAEAAAMFKDWLLGGPTLDDFNLDFDSFIETDTDNLDLGAAGFALRARNPWMRGGRRRKPTTEEQVQFLLVTMYLTPENNKLRSCPWCEDLFLARRSDMKYCSSVCNTRVHSGEHNRNMQAEIKAERILLCKEAYPKFKGSDRPLTNTANYVNTHRPKDRRAVDWKPIKKNFVSRNYKEIGIRESELKEARKKEAEVTKRKGAR